jgi:hypothetical protein
MRVERTKRILALALLLTVGIVGMQAFLLAAVSRFDLPDFVARIGAFPLFLFTRLMTLAVNTFGSGPPNAMEPPSNYLTEAEGRAAITVCAAAHVGFWYVVCLFVLRRRQSQAQSFQ